VVKSPLLLVAALALSGCSSSSLIAAEVRTQHGPSFQRPVRRVLALPATCGGFYGAPFRLPDPFGEVRDALRTLTASQCPPAAVQGADSIVRARMAFFGYDVIDSERVNAVTAARRLTLQSANGGPQTATSEARGARFEDATPRQQAEILRELGADAVVTMRIWLGSTESLLGRRVVRSQVQLRAVPEGTLIWARRCDLEIDGVKDTDASGMDRTARCAVEGTAP
jgi:hypothetical protein